MKKKPHGGARKGAGAPKKEPTVVMRIPLSKVAAVNKLLLKNSNKSSSRKNRDNKPPPRKV